MDLPLLDLKFPRELVALHQIEVTSRCNLACSYCPNPKLGRPKVDMTRAHFERALEWVRYYVGRRRQVELNLTGIGESTLHPDFPLFVRLAREAVGFNVKITIPTNGISMTVELADAVAPYAPQFWVSLHQPRKAALGVQILGDRGLLAGCSAEPAVKPNDWAGQVDLGPIRPAPRYLPCFWIRMGAAMAMADGRITTCCLDSTGIGVIGHVDDEIGSLRTQPYELCRKCYQALEVAGWDQDAGEARKS
jgi:hypothetical protein